MPKKPEYVSIAERFDVNLKAAGRAVQQLVDEGILVARPGLRAVPVPRQLRATRWPMTGRYARARAAQGLLFSGDVAGEIRKETVRREWVSSPVLVAQLLMVDAGTSVFERRSRTVINVRPAHDNVITFDTYEAPIEAGQEQYR
jgi:GntR family transcriptional regulator